MVPNEEAGYARLEPVSEVHPLTECRHFIAGHVSSTPLADHSSGIRGFYAQRQVVVIATVVDGDCGLDVACLMLGLPRTLANRSELRHALADYLCERAEEPWMQDLLVATAELDLDLVKESREESKPLPIPSEAVLVISEAAPPAPALEEVSSVEETSRVKLKSPYSFGLK